MSKMKPKSIERFFSDISPFQDRPILYNILEIIKRSYDSGTFQNLFPADDLYIMIEDDSIPDEGRHSYFIKVYDAETVRKKDLVMTDIGRIIMHEETYLQFLDGHMQPVITDHVSKNGNKLVTLERFKQLLLQNDYISFF